MTQDKQGGRWFLCSAAGHRLRHSKNREENRDTKKPLHRTGAVVGVLFVVSPFYVFLFLRSFTTPKFPQQLAQKTVWKGSNTSQVKHFRSS